MNIIDGEQVKMFSKMFNAKSNEAKVDDNIAAKGSRHTMYLHTGFFFHI